MANTTIYLIDSTDGRTTFAIQPRTFDGFGGVQQHTDLTLYGNATPNWGELFNENFYKVLESFAIDKQGFDRENANPLLNTYFPNDPTPHIPQTQFDVNTSTPGLGINNPIEGQLWYNKTDSKLYVYSAATKTAGNPSPSLTPLWRPVGSASTSASVEPVAGELWYDASTQTLNVYDDVLNWIPIVGGGGPVGDFVDRAGDTMTGLLVLSGDPVALLGAATKQYVDNNFISITGGVDSTMDLTQTITLGRDPTIDLEAATKKYVDDAVTVAVGGNYVEVPGDTMTGFLTLHAHPTTSFHAATKGYVDASIPAGNYVSKTGDTMSGFLTLNANPVNNLHAATKQYVDNAIPSGGRLTGVSTIHFAGYHDVTSSSFVTIGGFSVSVPVTTASGSNPVTLTAKVALQILLKKAGAYTNWELQGVGGAFVSPTTIGKVTTEGESDDGSTSVWIANPTMTASITVTQNATYVYSIRVKNSTTNPGQNVRLNATAISNNVADPEARSTIEVMIFS